MLLTFVALFYLNKSHVSNHSTCASVHYVPVSLGPGPEVVYNDRNPLISLYYVEQIIGL